jgi:Dolichyl-phosphate-mannose-protein mannosyltransferase
LNTSGFPAIFTDEGYYMGRALRILHGIGLQEFSFYDHPYFGQLFLAGTLCLIGYPELLNPADNDSSSVNPYSIELLYLIPRMLIGILAVVDTFLIYKIAERRYDNKVGFVSSILFAVMPATWLTRMILLDSLLLPFLLSSILLAMYIAAENNKRNASIILLSGILLGLAIFTKIPAFTMIPLVGFLVYTKSNKSLKILGLWLVPVILIPLIWPAYALSIGEFDRWLDGVTAQTHRTSQPLVLSIESFFMIDPILLIVGVAGGAFAAVKKDILVLLWAIPFLIFLYFIGYVSTFHLIPILPVLCISASNLIVEMPDRIKNKKRIRKLLLFVSVSLIVIFGLVNTTLLITTSLNFPTFESVAFTVNYLQQQQQQQHYNTNNNKHQNNEAITIISNAYYLWIPQYVFENKDRDITTYRSYDTKLPVTTKNILLIVDNGFKDIISANDKHGKYLRDIHNNSTNTLAVFPDTVGYYDLGKYPYNSIRENLVPGKIEIRTNYN